MSLVPEIRKNRRRAIAVISSFTQSIKKSLEVFGISITDRRVFPIAKASLVLYLARLGFKTFSSKHLKLLRSSVQRKMPLGSLLQRNNFCGIATCNKQLLKPSAYKEETSATSYKCRKFSRNFFKTKNAFTDFRKNLKGLRSFR